MTATTKESPHGATAREPGRTAAFFDLDGTLIPGSANIPLAKAAFGMGLVSKRELALDLAHGLTFILFGASDDRSATVRDRILHAVAGHPAAEVEALADGFLDDLIATITPAMRAVLAGHTSRGHDLVLVSASPTEIVQRFAAAAGMSYGAGTLSERDGQGRYTGKLAGPFCYKEGKAQVILELAAEHGYDLAVSYAYSDSISDLPMLRIVGNPVTVNPDTELRRLALTEGWQILDTSRLRGGIASVIDAARVSLRATWHAVRVSGRALSGAAQSTARTTVRGVSRATSRTVDET
ncbi:MAG TPA: HAD-IB family hydrolase [Candidatus Lustribacter sp.]|nr:HAD-IB family hydrolase [Candidatus Lustribacter sp.]